MKKIILTSLAALASIFALNAQNGSISPEMLSRISASYEGTSADKAIKNALAGTSIGTLAINSENLAMIDTHFSDRVKTKGITNQRSSGRCWLFTGMNVLRAATIEKFELPGLEFSQNYIFFYDQLEKANLFLQGIIDTRDLADDDRLVDWFFKNPIGDGCTFTGVANLISKYGLLPSDAMPETFCSNNTSQMSQLIGRKLREDGLKLRDAAKSAKSSKKVEATLLSMKEEMLGEIYRMLVLCLGVPPTEFDWNRLDSKGEIAETEHHTPMSFYEKYVGADLENNYVMVMNDPCREYYKLYEIQYDRHVYDGQNWLYINLPIEKIKEMAIASIKANTAMYFSCDVGKYSDRKKGLLDLNLYDYESLMGVSFEMNKQQRIYTHASGSSHAMTLIAVDLKDGEPVKWMVENSWGADSGYKGCMIMTDEWFNEYMFRLVVEKQFAPADVLEVLNQKPTLLPAWDPMFEPEE